MNERPGGIASGPSSFSRHLRRRATDILVSWQNLDVHRRLLALVACALVLSACRVDVTVDVAMNQNGSGRLAVTVVADAAVVNQAPGLAADLRLDDLAAAGWQTSGAVPTADGGLAITLTRPFDTPEQATALLSTLNGPAGPLQAINLQRNATERAITYTVTGTGRLDGGLDAFADSDLLATVGGTPYAEQITAAGLTPADVVGVVLRVRLPGDVESTTATTAADGSAVVVAPVTSLVRIGDATTVASTTASSGSIDGGGTATTATADAASESDEPRSVLAFPIALDGTETAVQGTTRYSLERGTGWSLLATLLLVLLIAWIVVAVVGIVVVSRRQRKRSRVARRVDTGLYQRVLDDTSR